MIKSKILGNFLFRYFGSY